MSSGSRKTKAGRTTQAIPADAPATNKRARMRWTSLQVKRVALITWVLAIISLVLFAEVIRPNQDANQYTVRLDKASEPLQACFDKLAGTTGLRLYYAPDVPITIKQADLTAIRQQIDSCRRQLASFSRSADDLMTFRLAGYTQTYREAKVNQRQAYDVIGQSTDVMNQYERMTGFLANYFEHIAVYQGYVAELSEFNTAVVTNANVRALNSQSEDLRKRAKAINELDSPAEFDSTKQRTIKLLTDTADGIDTIARGYAAYADSVTSYGFEQVESTTRLFDSTIINLPFEQLTASYIPKQVVQLPVKVENLLAAQSE